MSIFRINKNDNYTTMSNYHFRDKNLSLKAKGLLSLMLSLPDSWDYSIAGLVAICKENETSIKSALTELKENGYLIIRKCLPNTTKSGRYEYIYDIYENPKQEVEKQEVENQPLENLQVEIQQVENQVQLNTNILNTNKLNTNNKTKHKYGEYQRVLLTEVEYEKLDKEYGNVKELVTYLDEYIEMKGYKAKSHYLAIRKWVVDAVREQKIRQNKIKPVNSNHYSNPNQKEFEDLERFYCN